MKKRCKLLIDRLLFHLVNVRLKHQKGFRFATIELCIFSSSIWEVLFVFLTFRHHSYVMLSLLEKCWSIKNTHNISNSINTLWKWNARFKLFFIFLKFIFIAFFHFFFSFVWISNIFFVLCFTFCYFTCHSHTLLHFLHVFQVISHFLPFVLLCLFHFIFVCFVYNLSQPYKLKIDINQYIVFA